MQTNIKKEPLIRIAKRDNMSKGKGVLIRAAAIVGALIVDALFIFLVTGLNPIQVYTTMFQGTFGTFSRFMWVLRDMVMLLCIGIALAPAFKMKFWNIGAEGQVLIGGLATALCMVNFGDSLPTPLLFIVMIIASVVAGGLWGLIPAFFKARFNTNETLFTLMMNYVAIQLVACLTNIMRGEKSSLGFLNMGSKAGWLPPVFGQSYFINIIVVFVFAISMFIYLKHRKQGYEIAVVGESQDTARYAGINVKLVIMRTMFISGAICGICGFLAVSGKDHTISTDTAGGKGFTAIIVAWLAKFNTFYMILISFLLTFLEAGAHQIASSYSRLNDYSSDIITGIILFFILGCEFFINYKMIFRGKNKEAE